MGVPGAGSDKTIALCLNILIFIFSNISTSETFQINMRYYPTQIKNNV